ncbi:MAG: shikimate dehydrogenase [Elusimicrobia bacterium]|nr:shikimate dehydrogenase [Elusimicrobiota bacterium]MBD3412754.1 shikimate dehydrogenase [Elusimicrobiota bacterium]
MTSIPQIVGIIGYPLGHTLSPVMHEAAFKKCKLNMRYIPFEVRPQKLSTAIMGMRALNITGLNVTIPHKETVMEFVDEFDEKAQKIGAVNTIHCVDNKLVGYNTDAIGFLNSLIDEGGFNPKGKKAVVFGAGGAARAITASLALAGIQRMVITDIQKTSAVILSRHLKRFCDCEITVIDSGEDRALFWSIKESDLLVNATPVGIRGAEYIPVMIKSLHHDLFVYDVVYRDTKLVRTAKQKKLKVLNGTGMLVLQGAESFRIWTGHKPPIGVMRKAVEQHGTKR